MSGEEPPLEPADSETLALLRRRTVELNQSRRWDPARPQVGYFDAHPPRQSDPNPSEDS